MALVGAGEEEEEELQLKVTGARLPREEYRWSASSKEKVVVAAGVPPFSSILSPALADPSVSSVPFLSQVIVPVHAAP